MLNLPVVSMLVWVETDQSNEKHELSKYQTHCQHLKDLWYFFIITTVSLFVKQKALKVSYA